jgi:hypothetical protein
MTSHGMFRIRQFLGQVERLNHASMVGRMDLILPTHTTIGTICGIGKGMSHEHIDNHGTGTITTNVTVKHANVLWNSRDGSILPNNYQWLMLLMLMMMM